MTFSSRSAATAASVLAVCCVVAYAGWASARPDPFSELAGRWAGNGTVMPASGPAQSFKCVVTYIAGEDSSRLRQNLRCKNDNYRLDAATHLQIEGEQLTGHWQDNVNTGLNGTVSGKVKEGGFDIMLRGRFFQAKMTVEGSRCEQSVKVTPERADYIREVHASLKKC